MMSVDFEVTGDEETMDLIGNRLGDTAGSGLLRRDIVGTNQYFPSTVVGVVNQRVGWR